MSDTPSDTADAEADFTGALTPDLLRFMMRYKFAVDEILTKVTILKEEMTFLGRDCPIEHVSSRVKTPAAIAEKAARIGCPRGPRPRRPTDLGRRRGPHRVQLRLGRLRGDGDAGTPARRGVVLTKDYVAHPKPNGYKSLHLIIDTPVHLSDRVEMVRVEVQIRTVAMDFWASLEHKITYKYDGEVPETLRAELTAAAEVASRLDEKMQALHREVTDLRPPFSGPSNPAR